MDANQLKMARAAVGWGVRDLAEKAEVTANTVSRIENGGDAKQSTMAAMQAALEAAGATFLHDDGNGAGVRFKAKEGRLKKRDGSADMPTEE